MVKYNSTPFEKMTIIRMKEEEKKTYTAISRAMGCSERTARRVFQHYQEHGTVDEVKSAHRPRTVHALIIKRVVKRNRGATSEGLVDAINRATGIRVSPRTARRYRQAAGFRPRRRRPTMASTPLQDEKRRAWAQEHLKDDVKRWVFDDETAMGLTHTGDVVWCLPGEPTPELKVEDIRFSVRWWGAIWWGGCVFKRYSGSLNSQSYLDLLTRHVGPHTNWMRRSTFVSDGASFKWTQRVCDWFADRHITRLKQSPNSPQFNAIESIWSWQKHYIRSQSPRTKAEFVAAIDRSFTSVPRRIVRNYILHVADEMRIEAQVP